MGPPRINLSLTPRRQQHQTILWLALMTHHLPLPSQYSQSLKPSPYPNLLITPIKRKACTLNMKAFFPSPPFSKIAAPNSTTTSSTTITTPRQLHRPPTKLRPPLLIEKLNPQCQRCGFTSQHDLKHMIATNTPDIMVLSETKLQKGNKPQPWLH